MREQGVSSGEQRDGFRDHGGGSGLEERRLGKEDEGFGREEEGSEVSPEPNFDDMAPKFAKEPDSNVEHYFMDADLSYSTVVAEVGGLDHKVEAIESITQFLTLPIVTRRMNPRNHISHHRLH